MIEFTRIGEDDLETILRWRTSPEVSRYLFTDVDNDMEKQRAWFRRVSSDESCRYWLIRWKSLPVGVINLAQIDPANSRCGAGYYIGELSCRNLGAIVPPYLYNHVFREMGLNKIYGEVVAGNDAILRIHAMHGFREAGVYRQHVRKAGGFRDVILIELLAEDWLKLKRYRAYTAVFP